MTKRLSLPRPRRQAGFRHTSASPELFHCPADPEGRFERTSSSYEWNRSLNGRALHRLGEADTGRSDSEIYLLRDGGAWHPENIRNAVFADGHAGKESS